MESILKVEGICKSFPGVQALSNVGFEVRKGEVHGLVGENGAGKSTLMHILAGVYRKDAGRIFLEGEEVDFQDEKDAQAAGIGIVFQERSLVNDLSVSENLFAGRQPVKWLNVVDVGKMQRLARGLLQRVGLEVNPAVRVAELTSAQKQLVEIAKALSLDARILILDEPTATITERETRTLFALVRQLKSQGISIIYISHRLQELPEICDRVSVLKDGVYQGTEEIRQVSLDRIVTLMVGREITNTYDPRGRRESAPVLEVRDLTSTAFRNISFVLKRQEILGIAGLAGAGRTEIALALFGCDPAARGRVFLEGRPVRFASPRDAIRAGIGYLPEDRKEAGLFLDLEVGANIVAANLDRCSDFGLIVNDRLLRENALHFIRDLRISTPSVSQKVLNLSGGNQQKALLARWLMRDPRILIVDEPTRGVDVGAKFEIYRIIRDLATKGTSIIVISSELPEVLALCDRILVMWEGRLTGELANAEATEEKILHLASGLSVNTSVSRE